MDRLRHAFDRRREREPKLSQTPTPDTTSEKTLSAKETAAAPASDDAEHIHGFKLFIVLIAVSFVAFLMLLDTSIVTTAIPRITSDFHVLNDVGWYGSAYLLASAALQPLTGKFYSYLNSKVGVLSMLPDETDQRKWTFLTFLFIFELGSLVCGVAQSSKMLIVGRAIAGMGGSGIINGALTILASSLPLHKRPMYMGIMMSVAQFGIVLGPLIGGALTEYKTWRWCFYINLPLGGAVALLLLSIKIPSGVPEANRTARFSTLFKNLDLIGFCLFAPAAIQCLLALQWGGYQYPWNSAKIIGLFCGAGATLIVFFLWEWRVGDIAMVPLSILKKRAVWSSCLVMMFFFGSMMTAVFYLPIYFQSIRGASPLLSGVYLLPTIIPQMFFAIISGVAVGRLGYYTPWVLASGIIMSIGLGLISTFTTTTSTGMWIGYQVLVGVGRGCGLQMPIIAIQNNLPSDKNSIGMAILVFCQTFGGALFLALAETDFTSSLKKALPIYAPNVSTETVIKAGATYVRTVVPKADLPGVLEAYNEAVSHTFYLAAAATVMLFFLAWGMGWKKVSKPKKKQVSSDGGADGQVKEEV